MNLKTRARPEAVLLLSALLLGCPHGAIAQNAGLPVEQAQLAEKFERLEKLALRIAELVDADNPDRAKQLRDAIAKSRDLALSERFDAIVSLLEEERFAAASRDQTQLADNLDTLLGLLLADPLEARLEAERRRLREAIKEAGRLARRQQSLRSDTLDQEDPRENKSEQERLAEDTERLLQKLKKPGEEKNPADGSETQDANGQADAEQRAAERLSEAKQAMDRAAERMSQGERGGASDEQSQAQRELERAKEELEEALRQTREEEETRMLTRLATRLRQILGEQSEINRVTIETQESFGDEESLEKLSATAGISKREDDTAGITARAIRLLQEDGKSIAFVEVLSQAEEDMQTVSQRLKGGSTGAITVGIEGEIVEALEDAIAAVDAKLAEKANKEQDSQQPGQQPGGEQEQSLVDMLAELRMLKSLQTRILKRTQRYELQREAGELTPRAYAEAMQGLSARQRRAVQAAENLAEPE